MKKDNTAGESPMKLIFNYNDVFYSFIYDDLSGCVHRSREYALNYVYSGEMVLDNGDKQIHVGKGECVFIPRDHHITMYKRTCNGERYCGIFLMFTRTFLRKMYGQFEQGRFSVSTPKLDTGVMKLPQTVELTSLFASMTPYFNPEIKPQGDFMQLKMQEGLLALLHIDARFAPTLFDFNEPWKIDILDFMNENYMYEFSMEDVAHYTGRSLATFKRDFKKISDLTPEKWLIRKRLEVAYTKLKEGGKKVMDVYAEVGFKNPSHFSTAFKKQYGISPTAIFASAHEKYSMEEAGYPYAFRPLTTEDISALQELFRSTVLTVNSQDYTQEEVADWTSCGDDTKHWEGLLSSLYFLASLDARGNMTGFASISNKGYLHSMFVHKAWLRKGVASALLAKMEEYAAAHGVTEITSEVSITARPFFEKHGYAVKREQMRRANRLCLKNYVMTKTVSPVP